MVKNELADQRLQSVCSLKLCFTRKKHAHSAKIPGIQLPTLTTPIPVPVARASGSAIWQDLISIN